MNKIKKKKKINLEAKKKKKKKLCVQLRQLQKKAEKIQAWLGYTCQQGWHSGESTRLPPVWPGFDSRSRCHNLCGLSLLLVLVLAPRVFSRYSGFPPSIKTNISKFQFNLDVS